MSTFTQFNGPQGSSGPSAKDITAFIDAYNQLSVKLTAHLEATAPNDAAVHGIVSYVNSVKTELNAALGAKAENTALNDVRSTAQAAATKDELSAAVTNMQQLIAGKAESKDLTAKADKTSVEAVQNGVAALATSVDLLKAEVVKYTAITDIDDSTKAAFSVIIETSEYFIGKLKAAKVIDFTKWAHFSAPFAGTGALTDTATNGAYILGCLSLDWEQDENAPDEEHAHKSARAYIKYVNSNPFDAIVDMSVTKTADGFVGSLTVHLAKKSGTWKDLAFHLISGTNSKHKECVYLAVSSDGLSSSSSDYTNTNFRACGENFIPVGEDGYVTPTGMLSGITSAAIGTNASSLTAIDNLHVEQLWSDNYFDGDGYNLLRVVSKIDPDTDTTYRQLFIGDANHDEITFIKRPSMIVEDAEGNQVQAYFVTARDITNVTLPVGAIIRWAPVDDDGKLKNVPTGYLACDGSQISNADYPELCELLGTDIYGMAKLPTEDHSIIKAIFFNITDKASQPDYDELVEFSMLNKKINKEIDRAKETESGLSERIVTNAETINKEIIRATAKEAELAENISAESARAVESENSIKATVEAAESSITDNHTAIEEAEKKIADNKAAITAEEQRATLRETELQSGIEASDALTSAEAERAKAAENANTELIKAETERAKAAEATNAAAIASETSRAIEAETTLNQRVDHYEVMENRLQGSIDAEQQRAEAKETELTGAIAAETVRADTAEKENAAAITAEEQRATAAEQKNAAAIATEQQRAEAKETEIAGTVTAEEQRATAAEQKNAAAIATEQQRAEAKETEIAGTVTAEEQRARAAETENANNIAKETARATAAEATLNSRITDYHPDN